MSRFFDAGSDSDSESTQSDEPERFQQPKLTAAAFAVSGLWEGPNMQLIASGPTTPLNETLLLQM